MAPIAIAAIAFLAAWWTWILSPTVTVEHDRALADALQRGVGAALRSSSDGVDEARARDLVVAMRRELPRLGLLDDVGAADVALRMQRLEDSLRLGTYDVALHRDALDGLRELQLRLIVHSRDSAEVASRSRERANLMFILAFGLGLVSLLRPRGVAGSRSASTLGGEQLGRALFEVSPEAVSVADAHERIIAVNPAFCRVSGYDPVEAIGRTLDFNGSGEQDERFFATMRNDLARAGKWTGEIWQRRKSGEAYAEKVTRVRLDDEHGACCGYLTVSMDLSANKDAERLINWQAHHDALTKLPNRTLLLERLARVLVRRQRSEPGALLSIDIDRFKMVNDSVGPKLGDRLLIEAAMRIAMAARESDTVARLGSDEFAVMLPELGDADAERMARAIQSRLAEPFRLNGHEIVASASIGIAVYPEDGTEPGTVVQRSNAAMARAKELGGNAIVFYEADMNAKAQRRLLVESELRRAVREQQLVMYYQPIVDLRSRRVVGAEALMRWQHPQHGMIAPGEFIPVAEDSGLIVEMGRWVVGEVATQLGRWNDAALADLRVSINVSARQMQNEHDVSDLVAAIREAPSRRLTVEITESVLLTNDGLVLCTLQDLHRLGTRIALDDFGTGFSSLSYLRQFRFDVLKIDRSFVRDIEHSRTDLGLVASIVSMGRILGVEVVAEGVETQPQLAALEQVGCDLVQGYLYAKPLPAEEFARFARGFGVQGNGAAEHG